MNTIFCNRYRSFYFIANSHNNANNTELSKLISIINIFFFKYCESFTLNFFHLFNTIHTSCKIIKNVFILLYNIIIFLLYIISYIYIKIFFSNVFFIKREPSRKNHPPKMKILSRIFSPQFLEDDFLKKF
jgi:hypothetical protein